MALIYNMYLGSPGNIFTKENHDEKNLPLSAAHFLCSFEVFATDVSWTSNKQTYRQTAYPLEHMYSGEQLCTKISMFKEHCVLIICHSTLGNALQKPSVPSATKLHTCGTSHIGSTKMMACPSRTNQAGGRKAKPCCCD